MVQHNILKSQNLLLDCIIDNTACTISFPEIDRSRIDLLSIFGKAILDKLPVCRILPESKQWRHI